jgi:hypothetical protein
VPKRLKDLLTALLKRFLEALALILVLATASAQPAAPSSTIAPGTAPATPAASAVRVGTQANQAPPVIPSHITVELPTPTSTTIRACPSSPDRSLHSTCGNHRIHALTSAGKHHLISHLSTSNRR